MSRLKQVMSWIALEQAMPTELRDHKLVGNYQGRRECHLSGDWFLIYKLEDDTMILSEQDRIPNCLNNNPNHASRDYN